MERVGCGSLIPVKFQLPPESSAKEPPYRSSSNCRPPAPPKLRPSFISVCPLAASSLLTLLAPTFVVGQEIRQWKTLRWPANDEFPETLSPPRLRGRVLPPAASPDVNRYKRRETDLERSRGHSRAEGRGGGNQANRCFFSEVIALLQIKTWEAMPSPSAPIRVAVPPPHITSHGAKMARLHMYDWIVLVLLVVVDGVLNKIEPFHRFVGSDMLTDLRYPMKDNTVPFWMVPIYGIIGPMIIIISIYIKRRNVYDLHHAILGLLFSVAITAVLTDAIKDGVGRPRPDFFWRCFPNGVPAYDNVTTGVLCHGKASDIKEGHKSFPSGHTSLSFAGLGFLSWYLAGKIKVFDRRGHVAKLCIIFLPLLGAALVAVSRVDDYRHHWQDVCTGGVLGLVVASLCYLQFFPLPSDENGLWPHAYIQHIHNPEGAHTSATHSDSSPKLGAEQFV